MKIWNTIHRSLAVLILLFIAIHICNHLIGIWGAEAHIEFMDWARGFYRNSYVEPILLSALFIQVLLGLYFVYRSWGQRKGFFSRTQAISGCYLAVFLLLHVGTVIDVRDSLNIDTNFYFAVSGIHLAEQAYFFVPYYFLSVVAIFIHVAAATHWALKKKCNQPVANKVGTAIILIGITISLLIVSTLTGMFYDITVPAEFGVVFE